MTQEKGNWQAVKTNSILKSAERIFKHNDINFLTNEAYKFIMNLSGFIAHYDLHGFRATYADVRELRDQLDNEFFLSDAKRDENDGDFKKWYGDTYNKSVAETKRGLVALTREYKDHINGAGNTKDNDKWELIEECVKRGKTDPEMRKVLIDKF